MFLKIDKVKVKHMVNYMRDMSVRFWMMKCMLNFNGDPIVAKIRLVKMKRLAVLNLFRVMTPMF